MNPQDLDKTRLIISLLDKPIAFNRSFARVVGNSLTAGILLSQLFYWAKAKDFSEFYKISAELQEECFLGRTEFENARKKILDTGVFSLIKKGVPCKTYYQIHLDVLCNLLSNPDCIKPTNQFADKQHLSLHETSKLECMKPTSRFAGDQQTIINNKEYTENTTENTTSDVNLTPKTGQKTCETQ